MKSQIRFLLFSIVPLCALLAGPSQAAVINWTNSSSGSWNTPANWSPNQVPSGADTALITNGGTYTVTLGPSLAVANLTLGTAGGTGTQTLSWSGGTLSGCNLAIAASGVLDLNGSTAKNLVHSTINNAGTIAWTGTGQLIALVTGGGQSVLITNLASGLFDLQNDSALAFSDPSGWGGLAAYRFHNAGMLRKSAGTGTNSFPSQCSFINAGTIEMQQGALQFPNGFTSSGSFQLAGNSVIHLDGGTFTFGSASLKTGSGQLLVDGGDVVLNGTVPGLNWTGGRLVASSFTVATNATASISGAATKSLVHATINNAGTITWTGAGPLTAVVSGGGQSVLITNLAGGLFDLQSDSALTFADPGGWGGLAAYRFHNAGTLRKSAGTGTNMFPSQCAFINNGSVLLQQGAILFPGCQNNGSLSLLEGSSALFPLGLVNNGTLDLAANAFAYLTGGACSFGPDAQLIGSGHWVIPSGDVTLTGIIPSLTWTGGRLVASSFTVATNAVLTLSGSAAKSLVRSTVNNAGTITWTGAGQLIAVVDGGGQSVLITNLAGGLFDLQNDSALAFYDPGYGGFAAYRFHNAGTLRKSSGTGTNAFPSQCSFINAGTIEMQQGALQFPNGFTTSGGFDLAANSVIHLDGGTFSFGAASLKTGTGQLLVDGGDVVLNGTVPGLSWTGGRLVASTFTVATNGLASISGAADKRLSRSTINNAGTITWTGAGQLIATVDGVGQSVLITNLAGGLFDLQGDSALAFSDIGYGGLAAYRFHNAGTLRKSAGTGTNSFPSQCTFINTGSVLIQQGAILFPGCLNSGSLSLWEGSSAIFPLGLVNNGTLDLATNAVAYLTGGAGSFGPDAQLIGSGHWVIPSGDVILTGTIPSLTWTGGRLVSSSFTVAANAVLSVSGASAKSLVHSTINNAGTITWTGAGQMVAVVTGGGQSVLITNLAGGLFDLQSDSALAFSDPGYGLVAYRFHNAGTLRKSAGTGTNSFPSQCSFINAGTIELQQGALQFPNGFTSSGSFDLAGNSVIHLDGGTFTFGAASLKTGPGQLLVDGGDVVLNGTVPGLSWTGGRLVGSSFTVATNAVLSISGATAKSLVHATINNAGTITWTGAGSLIAVVTGGGQSVLITNLAGGLFDLQSDSALAYSDPGYVLAAYRFHNAGTLRKSAGTGTNSFPSQCTFINTGSVLIQQGAILFPGCQNNGSLSILEGSSAIFPLGLVNNGTLDLATNAVAYLTGGACSFGPGAQLIGNGHWVIPSGDVTLTGTIPSLTWTGGRLVASSFTVATNAVLTLSGSAAKSLVHSTINNAGTITWTGAGSLIAVVSGNGQSVLITNLAGGLFDLQSDSALAFSDPGYGLAYRFHNAGTLRKSAGPGTNAFPSQCSFINVGTIELQQGALQFPNGFTSSGSFNLAGNSVIHLDGGTFTFGAASLKTGAGQLLVDGGNVTVNGTVPGLDWTGGLLISCSFTVAPDAVLAISGSATKSLLHCTINNAGTITWTGAGSLIAVVSGNGQSVLITNLAGGLFDLQSDAALAYSDPGYGLAYRFHNAGTLRKSAGTGTNTFPSQCSFINTGTADLRSGTLKFNAAFTQTASGTLGLRDLNPAAAQPRLIVASTANFAGTLDLGIFPGTATLGQSFAAMTFGTRVGTFAQTTGLILGGGLWLRPTFNPQNLTLTIEGPPKTLASQVTADGFKLAWQGEPGVTYQVFGSTNLVNWQLLFSTNTPNGFFQFVDPDFPARPQRFYGATVQ